MEGLKTFKIFISSPSDVAKERWIAKQVIEALFRKYKDKLKIEIVLYEDRVQLANRGDFQSQIERPSQSDLTIVILWSRLGSPLSSEYRGEISGKVPVTGTEWEFEDALKGALENNSPDLLVYKKTAPLIGEIDSKEAEVKKQEKKKVEEFFKKWFHNKDNSFKAAYYTFKDEFDFKEKLFTHLEAKILEFLKEEAAATISDIQNPYRGLLSFEIEHKDIFFGREQDIKHLSLQFEANIKANSPFLLILGASGSGKSSLLKAGLLPEIATFGFYKNIDSSKYAIFLPSKANNLIKALSKLFFKESVLKKELEMAGFSQEELEEFFNKDDKLSTLPIKKAMLENQRVVIAIDQFEEIFTTNRFSRDEIEKFANILKRLIEDNLVWIIGSIRNEFISEVEKIKSFRELTIKQDSKDGRYLLSFPSVAQIGEIVRNPAKLKNISFEEKDGKRLDKLLIDEASKDITSLPLLEYTLSELYEKRDKNLRQMSFKAYNELGGLFGAIGKRAEDIYNSLSKEEQKAIEKVLVSLVGFINSNLVAKTLLLEEIKDSTKQKAINKFIENRLFIKDINEEEKAIIKVAHEALFTNWQRAKDIIKEYESDIILRERLIQRAKESDDLLKGTILENAIELLEKRGKEFVGKDVANFITKSYQSYKKEKQKIFLLKFSIISILLLAIALISWKWIEAENAKKIALIQKEKAIKTREAAEGVINKVLFELKDELDKTGNLDTLKIAYNAVKNYYDKLGNTDNSPEIKRRIMVFYMNMGDYYWTLGNLQKAKEYYKKALDIDLELTKLEPNNAQFKSDLSVGYIKLGDLFSALGNLEKAKEYYEKSLKNWQELISIEPKNTDWKRGITIPYNKLGDLFIAFGNLQKAKKYYKKSLNIVLEVTKLEPNNAQWKRDLSISYERLGDLFSALGNLEKAKEYYKKALNIREELTKLEPNNAKWKRDLSVSYNKLGDLYKALGNLQKAKEYYEKALEITLELTKLEPNNAKWKRDLSVSYERLGDFYKAIGNLERAKEYYEKALNIRKELIKLEPNNAKWKRDLSVSYNKLGNLYKTLGNLKKAKEYYEKLINNALELTKLEPNNAQWKRDLSVSYIRMYMVTNNKEYLKKAYNILKEMKANGALKPADEKILKILEEELNR